MKYRVHENTKKKFGRGKIFLYFPKRSDCRLGPPSILFNAYRVFFSGLNRSGLEVNLLPLSSAVWLELYLYLHVFAFLAWTTFTSFFVFQPILTHTHNYSTAAVNLVAAFAWRQRLMAAHPRGQCEQPRMERDWIQTAMRTWTIPKAVNYLYTSQRAVLYWAGGSWFILFTKY